MVELDQVRAAERSPGLVLDSTSDTVTLDPRAMRRRRFRRNVVIAASCLNIICQADKGSNRRAVFGTLTYRPGVDWGPRHVAGFLKRVREWLRRKGESSRMRYVWIAELQRRGAVHYHFLLWLPRGLSLPKPDKRGWWPHGSTNLQLARRPVGYLVKYLSKSEEAELVFPPGCRLYGVGGLDDAFRRCRRWLNLPSMLQGLASVNCDWRRAPGGGWINPDTGEWLPSEWGLRSASACSVSLKRLWSAPRLIDADGPFCWLPTAA